jgi:hypothetical protein
MQINKNNIDDLDYIAQLGFEQVSITESDLKDLDVKIKKRIFSYNNGSNFAFISLIVGVFIGISVFFALNINPEVIATNKTSGPLNDSTPVKINANISTVILDTVNIIKENFVNPLASNKKTIDTNSIISNKELIDTVSSISSKPINVALILGKNVNELKIKYILNAPIVYIHDLKVTNYTTLYFKKNQYIKFAAKEGLPVSYANKDDYAKSRSGLKQSADYYLHEELSDALLSFKKGNYGQCIFALNVISSYNDEDINCNFYLGMCYYYKKSYKTAIDFFQRCIESSNNTFFQEAMYYSALSLYEKGEKDLAIEQFKLIADEGEFYSDKAKVFLKN